MRALWNCCKRFLLKNKGQAFMTILGVALATGLITAVACLSVSMILSYAEYLKKTEGTRHGIFLGVEGKNLQVFLQNPNIEQLSVARREGYAHVKDECFLELVSISEEWLTLNGIRIIKGRFPQADNEILLNNEMRTEWGEDVSVGDEITLDVGAHGRDGEALPFGESYQSGDEILPESQKTYVVVGLMKENDYLFNRFQVGPSDRNAAHAYMLRAYVSLDGEETKAGNWHALSGEDAGKETGDDDTYYDVAIRYDNYGLKHFKELTAQLLDIPLDVYRKIYDWEIEGHASKEEMANAARIAKETWLKDGPFELIRMEGLNLLNQGTYVFFFVALIAFLILIFIGVFCINNSFDISFAERVRFYGMMSSIGATKAQIRLFVLMEGGIIAAIGIPFGIILGILTMFGLVQFSNFAISILEKNSAFVLSFHVSGIAILLAIVMSLFMVWLSASESAEKAAKVTPIMAVRANEIVKSSKRGAGKKRNALTKERTPKFVKNLFGLPKHLAWLHYQRAKVKYRGSITAIAISAALFVGLSFISLFFEAQKGAMEERISCQLSVSTYEQEGDSNYHKLKELLHYPGVTKAEISAYNILYVEEGEIPYLPGKPNPHFQKITKDPLLMVLDEESFEDLCKRAGVSFEEAKGKGIVSAAEYELLNPADNYEDRIYQRTGESLVQYHKGDVCEGVCKIFHGPDIPATEIPATVEIIAQADDIRSLGTEKGLRGYVIIYVDEQWAIEHPEIYAIYMNRVSAYFLTDDVSALEEAIHDAGLLEYTVWNYDKEYQSLKFTELMIKTFLFSFLFIVALIGISNVINSISTNMALRGPEFARLRAIGMTGRQFREMIWTETVILGGKGVIWGSLFGIGISYSLYRFMWWSGDKKFRFAYHLPFWEMGICVIIVGFALFLVTKGSLKRAQERGILETIREEGIS